MPSYKISTIAGLLGVSDDTVRRWLDDGALRPGEQASGPATVDGASVVELLKAKPETHQQELGLETQSIRNHLAGLVVNIVKDRVMSQVELQCGAYRMVSLVSTEAVEQLGLEVGSVAVAQVKATNVSLKLPEGGKL